MAAARSKRTMLAGLGAAKPRLVVEGDRVAFGPSPLRPIGTLRSGTSKGAHCADSGRCSRLLRNRGATPGRLG